MHFRLRGNAIQLVRTSYSPEKKGAKSEVVGRMPNRARGDIPEALKAKLTPQEVEELQSFLNRTQAIDMLQRKVAAHTLGTAVATAVEYAASVTDEAERDQLNAIFTDAVLTLRRGMARGAGGKGGGKDAAKGGAADEAG